MQFEWDAGKNTKLQAQRGVSFEQLRDAILTPGNLLAVTTHPKNQDQEFLVVQLKGYIWIIVTEIRDRKLRLITAYPSRKWRKIYGP